MDVRLSAIEAKCAACLINFLDVRALQQDISTLKVDVAEIRTEFAGLNHYLHNGGNPVPTERRIRALENWRAFLLGAGTLFSIMATTAIAWLAR